MISRYLFNSERIQKKKKKKPTREVSEKNSERRPASQEGTTGWTPVAGRWQ